MLLENNLETKQRSMGCERSYLDVTKNKNNGKTLRNVSMNQIQLKCHQSVLSSFSVRSRHPEVFCKKGVLRNFANFTGISSFLRKRL